MATFTNTTKNTSTATNVSKNSVTLTATNKTLSIGLWNILTFPWQESLPWQFAAQQSAVFTNQTKN